MADLLRKKDWWVQPLIVAGSVFAGLFLSGLLLLEGLELKTLDARFGLRGPLEPIDSSLVVVAIDDEAFLSLPSKWPFPRTYYARAIRNLARAGARLIVLDIELTERSYANPAEDSALVRAVREAGNVIVAGKVVYEAGTHGLEYAHLLRPFPELEQAALAWGLVNALEDVDGFIRRYPLWQRVGRDTAYSLATQVFRALRGELGSSPRIEHGHSLCFGDGCIPQGARGWIYINYAGPALSYRTYSLAHVLDDSGFFLPPDEDTDIFEMHLQWGTFRDKVVFLGASAEELQDNKYTPYFRYLGRKQKMPGVETHVNALATMLAGNPLRRFGAGIQFLILLLFSAGITLLCHRSRPSLALAGMVGMWVLYIAATTVLFARLAWVLPVVSVGVVSVLSYVGSIAHRVATQEREKRFYRDTFAHYVSKEIVDLMLSSGQRPRFGGEHRVMTVLFSDIRGFTTYCELCPPEQVVEQLSEYLSAMVEVIFAHGGTLDKFVGDAIMALYGAPYYFEDHALRACRTAVKMLERLQELHRKWEAEGRPLLDFGVGINTGRMIVGNLGSRQLFDYTVIGDNVNVGARLEGTNKRYGTHILISESTYLEVRDHVVAREVDLVRVKGKTQPLRIYELLAVDDSAPELRERAERFEVALSLYRERRWAEALQAFYHLLQEDPEDGPSRLYVERCLNLLEHPPGPSWDAVTDMW